MPNGDILDILENKIEAVLKDQNLRKTDRTLLEIQQLFVTYLKSDHKKIEEIYPLVIEQQKSLKERRDTNLHYLQLTVGTALTSIVVLIINGIVYFFKILPILDQAAKGGQ